MTYANFTFLVTVKITMKDLDKVYGKIFPCGSVCKEKLGKIKLIFEIILQASVQIIFNELCKMQNEIIPY